MGVDSDVDPELFEPAVRAIWTKLLSELNDYKAKIQSLSEENASLREQLTNYPNISTAESPVRRKQAKTFDSSGPTASVNINKNCTNNDGNPSLTIEAANEVNGDKGSTVIGNENQNKNRNSNVNRKKIIQAIDTNIASVRKSLKEANCKQFTLKQIKTNAPIKIAVSQADEVPAIRKALKNANVSFHEFKLESEKNKCYVIRGLAGVTSEELTDIHQELISAGIPAESTLSMLTTGYMRANPEAVHSSLLKLVLPPNFDEQAFKPIKYIDHVAVSFESLKSKPVVQCKNCQRFGHSAGGCQHSHRCVKCGEDHLRDQCPRTHNKSIKLVCCNCRGEHTANNLAACSFFQKTYVKPAAQSAPGLNIQTSVSKDSNTPTPTASAVKTKSYAAAARGTSKMKWDGVGNQPTAANLVDIAKKLDMIMEMVTRHDVLLQNRNSHD